jgi:hypothetical protein
MRITSKTLLATGKWKRRFGKGQAGSTADVELMCSHGSAALMGERVFDGMPMDG